MNHSKITALALAIVGAALVGGGPALAMQPAQTKAGLEVGAEAGLGISNGNKYAVGGDLDYGIHTGWLGSPYTAVVLDALNAGRTENVAPGVTADGRATLATLGIRQPLNVSGSVPVSAEAGVTSLSVNASVPGFADVSKSATGGFLGARATWAQSGPIGITGMLRYHFVSGGIYQAGIGLTGPINKGTGLSYQIDYYHTGGGHYAGVSSVTDSILLGIRFTAKP